MERSRFRAARHVPLWGAFALTVFVAGCTQIAVLGKILVGDPKIEAAFSQITGTSLEKGARVALVCTAPASVLSEYDSCAIDVQDQLERLMTRRGIKVVSSDEVVTVLNGQGGQFDAQLVAQEIDADFVLHIDIEYFDYRVPHSPNLYQGLAGGNVYGYEITESEDSSLGKHAIQVFEREFRSEYPGQHPVPADRTPERVFRNRFIDSLSAELGRMFYDFRTQESF